MWEYSKICALEYKYLFLLKSFFVTQTMSTRTRRKDRNNRLYKSKKTKLEESKQVVEQTVVATVEFAVTVENSRCLLVEAADAILCQVFAFLNVREHWKLSRGSKKINQVSLLAQASPTLVDIPHQVNRSDFFLQDDYDKVVQRLLNFRPLKLVLPPNIKPNDIKPDQMTQLRELAIAESTALSFIDPNFESNSTYYQWLSELTHLEKLQIPDNIFRTSIYLPDSLTHLDIFATDFSRFTTELLYSRLSPQLARSLQVLKLPMGYHQLGILKIGDTFPFLRELRLGYFDLRNHPQPTSVDFSDLKSCKHLETLTVSIDPNEASCRWETLSCLSSLRSLTVVIYRPQISNGQSLFQGLSQLTQLIQLKLLPQRTRSNIDISFDIPDLTALNADALDVLDASSVVLPQLKTLLIEEGLTLRHKTNLYLFRTVEELKLPESIATFPDLPRVHTLHVSENGIRALNYYKDQVQTVFYRDAKGIVNDNTEDILHILSKMKNLTTVKLHPCCAVPRTSPLPAFGSTKLSVVEFLKLQLSATVQVEIDSSMGANEDW